MTARLGEVDFFEGRHTEAVDRMERAFAVLSSEETDADVAALAAQLGRLYYFIGDRELALSRIEFALDLAEKLDLAEQLSQALNTKAVILHSIGRNHEAEALIRHSLQLALDEGLSGAALRAYNNAITFLEYHDSYEQALSLGTAAVELARRTGDKTWEMGLLGTLLVPLLFTGRWNELLERAADIGQSVGAFETCVAAVVHAQQGDFIRARALLDSGLAQPGSPDLQVQSSYWSSLASVLRAEGESSQALVAAEAAIEAAGTLPISFIGNKLALVAAAEASLELGDNAKAANLLARMERLRAGETTPFYVAQAARIRALIPSSTGADGAEQCFGDAAIRFREIGAVFWLAVTLLEHGELLLSKGRLEESKPLLAEAQQIFERLGARPWLDRLAKATSSHSVLA